MVYHIKTLTWNQKRNLQDSGNAEGEYANDVCRALCCLWELQAWELQAWAFRWHDSLHVVSENVLLLHQDLLVSVEHDAAVLAAAQAPRILTRVAGRVALEEEVAGGLALVAERRGVRRAALLELATEFENLQLQFSSTVYDTTNVNISALFQACPCPSRSRVRVRVREG